MENGKYQIMKQLIERIGHLPTTALGLLFIAIAGLHFSGIVTIQEMGDFAHGLDALLIMLGLGGIAAKSWPKLSASTPPEEEPPVEDPPATPLPNPSTPRPPKK